MAVMGAQYKHPPSAYTQGLRDLIDCTLKVNPKDRPDIHEVRCYLYVTSPHSLRDQRSPAHPPNRPSLAKPPVIRRLDRTSLVLLCPYIACVLPRCTFACLPLILCLLMECIVTDNNLLLVRLHNSLRSS